MYFTNYSSVPGRVGSARGALWFCTEHSALGEARTHMTSGQAVDDIRAGVRESSVAGDRQLALQATRDPLFDIMRIIGELRERAGRG
ncbi:hypothetical protein [Yinghuangia soli]|uniref:Uncharacterized protein n=1 Tax=Yinghuangia soli TaxID=2908204 RepID=A0AA41Q3S2_9ACTN|nr:hypothetical protein [Yinghuangia soli]MCF2530692.1 hypothetical protein [Yinghuangia soli]